MFVGLGLGPELGAQALARVARTLDPKAWRLPRSDGLHVTLFFMGDVARRDLPDRIRELEGGLRGARAPELVLGCAGAFPKRGAERVLWLSVREAEPGSDLPGGGHADLPGGAHADLPGGGHADLHRGRLADPPGGALADLHRRTLAALRSEDSRTYRPHVTVARPRRAPGHAPEAFFDLDLESSFRPREATLYESTRPGPGPPVYAALATFPLLP